MKVKLTVTLVADVDLDTYLEEDERAEDAVPRDDDDTEWLMVSKADLLERFSSAIEEGDESVDDHLNGSSDFSVTAVEVQDGASTATSPVWTEKLTQSQVEFVNSIVEQIPETFGAREAFIDCLQKFSEAQ